MYIYLWSASSLHSICGICSWSVALNVLLQVGGGSTCWEWEELWVIISFTMAAVGPFIWTLSLLGILKLLFFHKKSIRCYKYDSIIISQSYINESTNKLICCSKQKCGFYLLRCSFLSSKIVFFWDIYINLLILLVKNSIFCEIPFSKANSVF